jgi:hypothetical protein
MAKGIQGLYANIIRGRIVLQLFRLMKCNVLVGTTIAYMEFYVA